MESRSDYPNAKAWEIAARANILSPKKPLTYHIQSSQKASFKKAHPKSLKKSINTKPSIWLQTKALHDRTDTSNCTLDK
jgi:hypothetical protein